MDFPGGSDGKASAYNVGGPGSNPWVGNGGGGQGPKTQPPKLRERVSRVI